MKLIIDIPEVVKHKVYAYGLSLSPSDKEQLINAIMNGIPLDKIRAEIEGLTYYWCEVNPKSVIDDVLQIIDKYREGGD